jgi:hypothetical protein
LSDRDHLDHLAGADHDSIVKAAGGPDLTVDSHAADPLVVGDPDDNEGSLAHHGSRSGAQRHWPTLMSQRERKQQPQNAYRNDQEDEDREGRSQSGEARSRGHQRTQSQRSEHEPLGVHLARAEHEGRHQPDDPELHPASPANAQGVNLHTIYYSVS